jgi:predicted enzyme related to lactoylglutathione lyase
LSTPDPDAAKAYYGELFGWEAVDMPAGDGMVYTMMRLDGQIGIAPDPQGAVFALYAGQFEP